ncbi:MAG: phytoene desaturase [Saprospiraceae bacterium]|nr:phytoene desaturase [Saprospiraceae bacterium]
MEKTKAKVIIIGSGIAGLAASIDLALNGFQVEVFEKNESFGGRGRMFSHEGFKFDMGPSWYWMPDIFEDFFKKHNSSTKEYFELKRLSPSYRIFFKDEILDAPSELESTFSVFEQKERNSSHWLKKFLADAKYKYEVGMKEFVRKPSLHIFEYVDIRLLKQALRLDLTNSIQSVIHRNIKNEKLRTWLKFPVLFLGAKPEHTPALYSLMNYADFELGTWYPKGGMFQLFHAMYQLAVKNGVKFNFNSPIRNINVERKKAVSITVDSRQVKGDYIISAADYQHTENVLLEKENRQYSEAYWEKRSMAPSSVIFYLGVNKKLEGLLHHNLFFDADFDQHSSEIYDTKTWPKEPLFYVSVPSKTDTTVAPEGSENVFVLIPIAPGIQDSEEKREELFKLIKKRIEKQCNTTLDEHIVFKKSYAMDNFIEDYNSFKGNAYGLSNVLSQTAFLKPRIRSKKVSNLFFAGQLTHPGPGLPPSLISGEIASSLIQKDYSK